MSGILFLSYLINYSEMSWAASVVCPQGVSLAPSAQFSAMAIYAFQDLVNKNGLAGKGGRNVQVSQLGATGDGRTDDSEAIQNAINFLKTGDTLTFSSGTTYAVGSAGWVGLRLANKTKIKVNGNGAILKALAVPSQKNPVIDNSFVIFVAQNCTTCDVDGLIFDNNGLATGGLGANASTDSVFRNLVSRNGLGESDFWSVSGQNNQWLSNQALRTNPGDGNGYGMIMGNTNIGFQENNLNLIGNSVFRNKWDGIVLVAAGATMIGNSSLDNTWSGMISSGWINNMSHDHVVIGNYLANATNHQYQVDFMPDGSMMNGLMLFGNWLDGSTSGVHSTGAYLNKVLNSWVVSNKVININYTGIMITGFSQHMVVSKNDIIETRTPAIMVNGSQIAPYADPVHFPLNPPISDIQIFNNSLQNLQYGIAIGANGDNRGGLRDQINVDSNYGNNNGQKILVGPGDGITVGSWPTSSPISASDGSRQALTTLVAQMPAGNLHTALQQLLNTVSGYNDSYVCKIAPPSNLRIGLPAETPRREISHSEGPTDRIRA